MDIVKHAVVEQLPQILAINQFNVPPTQDELMLAIKVMNTGETPENIVTEMVQQGGEVMLRLLSTIFQRMCARGKFHKKDGMPFSFL